MGYGDKAARPQHATEPREPCDGLTPEQRRVDGQDLVERRIELGELVD